jgi:hypothetical protein
MVHEKSKHLLASLYRGRLDGDVGDTAAFSDVYTMKRMSKERPGKIATTTWTLKTSRTDPNSATSTVARAPCTVVRDRVVLGQTRIEGAVRVENRRAH